MKKKQVCRLLTTMLSSAMVMGQLSAPTYVLADDLPETVEYEDVELVNENEEPVEINEKNFPDDIFRQYISENFDTSKDGVLSAEEIEEIKVIDVNEMGISSLKGIESFPNLR